MPPFRQHQLNAPGDDRYSGRVKLWLRGFSRQSVVSVDAALAAIGRLPSPHLHGLHEIIYDPDRSQAPEIAAWLSHPSVKGSFLQHRRTVLVHDFRDEASFFHVLYHEIAHFLYYVNLASELKKRWVTQIYPGSGFVTRRAEQNASEDFAESYATFLLNPPNLRRIPAKYAFMSDVVFGTGFKPKRG